MLIRQSLSTPWLAVALLLGSVFAACGSSDSHQATLENGGGAGGLANSEGGAAGASVGAQPSGGANPGVAGQGGDGSALGGAGGAPSSLGGSPGVDSAGADAGGAGGADAGGCLALHFAADTDTAIVPSNSNMDFGASGTIELWLLLDGSAGSVPAGSLFNKWVNFQEDKFLSMNSVGAINGFFHTSGGSVNALSSESAVLPGAWTHVAVSYDTTSVRLYANGVKVGEELGEFLPANSNGDVQIGHITRDFTEAAVHGFYSELRLSQVARYSADFTPDVHLAADVDTLALWKLDEGSGDTIADSSGNDNSGTLVGPSWQRARCR